MPLLAIHLDNDTCSDQEVDIADTWDARLRREPKTRGLKGQSHERLGARARSSVSEVHPWSSITRHDRLERRQLMRADDAHAEGAVEHGDGELARKASHALRHRIERSDPPGLCCARVDERVPMCAELRSIGKGQRNSTAVSATKTRCLVRQPDFSQPLFGNPQTEALCSRGARRETPDTEGSDDVPRRMRWGVHAATRANDDF